MFEIVTKDGTQPLPITQLFAKSKSGRQIKLNSRAKFSLVLAAAFLFMSWEFDSKDKVNENGDIVRTHFVEVLSWDLPSHTTEIVPRKKAAIEQLPGAIVDHNIQRVYEVKSGRIDLENSDELKAQK